MLPILDACRGKTRSQPDRYDDDKRIRRTIRDLRSAPDRILPLFAFRVSTTVAKPRMPPYLWSESGSDWVPPDSCIRGYRVLTTLRFPISEVQYFAPRRRRPRKSTNTCILLPRSQIRFSKTSMFVPFRAQWNKWNKMEQKSAFLRVLAKTLGLPFGSAVGHSPTVPLPIDRSEAACRRRDLSLLRSFRAFPTAFDLQTCRSYGAESPFRTTYPTIIEKRKSDKSEASAFANLYVSYWFNCCKVGLTENDSTIATRLLETDAKLVASFSAFAGRSRTVERNLSDSVLLQV